MEAAMSEVCCKHGIHMENACGECIPPRGTKVHCKPCDEVGAVHCADPANCQPAKRAALPMTTQEQREEAAKHSDWCPHCGQGWGCSKREQANRVDAQRYRFLRKGFGDFGPDVDLHNAFVDGDEKMDAAIDKAMLAELGAALSASAEKTNSTNNT
jgi:hypothetical protein